MSLRPADGPGTAPTMDGDALHYATPDGDMSDEIEDASDENEDTQDIAMGGAEALEILKEIGAIDD